MEEEEVKAAFETFGNVERVRLGEFASKRMGHHGKDTLSGGSCELAGERHAHIVFEKAASCRAALSCSDVIEVPDEATASGSFVSMVLSAHQTRNVSADDLQASVNAYMAGFDERTEAEKRARREGLIDDDGFQLVTYKRKNRHVDPLTIEAPQKKRKELTDFYRFQIREQKRSEVATLRAKFEADKKRIEQMKMQRKFKPF